MGYMYIVLYSSTIVGYKNHVSTPVDSGTYRPTTSIDPGTVGYISCLVCVVVVLGELSPGLRSEPGEPRRRDEGGGERGAGERGGGHSVELGGVAAQSLTLSWAVLQHRVSR